MSRKIWLSVLVALFCVLWIVAAISPLHRSDWVLENLLTVAAVVVLWSTRRALPLSLVSYSAIVLFLCLHTVGAHYTYAEVPYDSAFARLAGTSLNELLGWERNNFDRIVHFSYGLLLAYPIRELFLRVVNVRGFWGYFLPLDLTMSTSMLYELIEWAVAEIFGGDLGMAYLGTQGDVWDAHKDMGLAALGALICMSVVAAVNAALQRDFAQEWVDSLRVHDPRPLGEEAIQRMRAHQA